MTLPLHRPATSDGLFLWVLHRFAERFAERAIVKGGLALRLLDCPRLTNDIDYVFAPFRSKRAIHDAIAEVLKELPEATVDLQMHSRMLRARVTVDGAAIQIEATTALECGSMALPTASLAAAQGQPSRIVRVMRLDQALAHKLAAWNERRLQRDLYDCYFLSERLGEAPDWPTLDRRLRKIESRLPTLRLTKTMTRTQLANELRIAAAALDDATVRAELAPILPATELVGLPRRMRGALTRIAELLEQDR